MVSLSARRPHIVLRCIQSRPCHYFGNVTQGWQGPGVIVPQSIYEYRTTGTAGELVVSFNPGIRLSHALQLGAGQGYDNRPQTTRPDRARLTLRLLVRPYNDYNC